MIPSTSATTPRHRALKPRDPSAPGLRRAREVDLYVAKRLRAARNMRGMSQEDLAAGLGVTFQQLQKYENGANRVSAGRLLAIARKLNLPVAFFFEGAPGDAAAQERRAEVVNDIFATPDGADMVRAYTKIEDTRLRRRVVDLIAAMVN